MSREPEIILSPRQIAHIRSGQLERVFDSNSRQVLVEAAPGKFYGEQHLPRLVLSPREFRQLQDDAEDGIVVDAHGGGGEYRIRVGVYAATEKDLMNLFSGHGGETVVEVQVRQRAGKNVRVMVESSGKLTYEAQEFEVAFDLLSFTSGF